MFHDGNTCDTVRNWVSILTFQHSISFFMFSVFIFLITIGSSQQLGDG